MLFFEECEGLSESIDLCYAMMNAPLFERPLLLWLSGFLAFTVVNFYHLVTQ